MMCGRHDDDDGDGDDGDVDDDDDGDHDDDDDDADVDDDDNSGNGDGSTRKHPEENVDERAPQLEVEPITTPRRGTRSQTARNEKEQRRAWDRKIEAVVDRALEEPLAEADVGGRR